jgi:branched-chain amino acid transport system ATP-binding protein
MNLLALEKVNAFYGNAHILHDVSLEVNAGERVAILGRNGVGKTTVVNSILGVARVPNGGISLAGKKYKTLRHFNAARAGVSVVPQGRRIIPGLTVRENLQLGASVNRKGEWNMESVFALFPILKERVDTPGTAMSGGQQQMLAIGRTLMSNPDLLILDEPSEGLSPVMVDELSAALIRLAERGTGILLIEQNVSLVHRVARRYYVLSKGSVVDSGALEGVPVEKLKEYIAF